MYGSQRGLEFKRGSRLWILYSGAQKLLGLGLLGRPEFRWLGRVLLEVPGGLGEKSANLSMIFLWGENVIGQGCDYSLTWLGM